MLAQIAIANASYVIVSLSCAAHPREVCQAGVPIKSSNSANHEFISGVPGLQRTRGDKP
jgi:hypothetical protein